MPLCSQSQFIQMKNALPTRFSSGRCPNTGYRCCYRGYRPSQNNFLAAPHKRLRLIGAIPDQNTVLDSRQIFQQMLIPGHILALPYALIAPHRDLINGFAVDSSFLS